MEFFSNTHIDFLGKKKIAFAISGIVILIGVVFFFINGGFNFNIDFTGGTILEIGFDETIEIGQVRKVVEGLNIGSPSIQTIGREKKEVIVRFQESDEGNEDLSLKIITALKEAFPDKGVELRRTEMVGPKIGSELRATAVKSIVFALALMLLYIWIRFQFRFGVAAIIALIHDVAVTLAIFVIFDIEIGLAVIAALLTLIGYSINDTIVISDRIRENMKVLFRKKFTELVNISLNQVFSRTVVTSLTTLIVVLAVLLFAGPAIFEFALALTIGVVVGTYSSIYIVSPVVVYWEKKFPKKVLK